MANESTLEKMYDMRLSVMARAYRDQEHLPLVSEMTFDERLSMIIDAQMGFKKNQ